LSIIVCHNQWLAILLLASVVMMGCAFAFAVLAVLYPSTDHLDVEIAAAMKRKRPKANQKKLEEFVGDN